MGADQTLKADGGKLRPSLFPWRAINPVLRVLEFGARKYAAHSWQGVEPERYVDALQRHVIEWGERLRAEGVLCTDHESGLPTLAHIACNALFLLAHPGVTAAEESTPPPYRMLNAEETIKAGDECLQLGEERGASNGAWLLVEYSIGSKVEDGWVGRYRRKVSP